MPPPCTKSQIFSSLSSSLLLLHISLHKVMKESKKNNAKKHKERKRWAGVANMSAITLYFKLPYLNCGCTKNFNSCNEIKVITL